MDRDTGMTVNPITSASAFRLLILATHGHACVSYWAFSALPMYFSIRMCTDIYGLPCMA